MTLLDFISQHPFWSGFFVFIVYCLIVDVVTVIAKRGNNE